MIRLLVSVALVVSLGLGCDSEDDGAVDMTTSTGATTSDGGDATTDTGGEDGTTASDTGSTSTSADTGSTTATDTGSTTATDTSSDTGSTSPTDTGGGDDTSPADVAEDTSMAGPPPPTSGAELEGWLAAGHYQAWPAESAPHDSAGPHFGTVRTFVNDAMFASFEADNDVHPVGAALVKELYGDGTEVLGYAVMVKVAPEATSQAWYWYEGYQGTTYADGTGVSLCSNCHSGGTDHVLTPFPLQ